MNDPYRPLNPVTPPDERGPAPPPRTLFLDDDPARAEVFLEMNPHAVWVQTAAECIARLEEPWDEVHLDHDLGGEHYVDLTREDCGMEVVRWVSLHPRPHLKPTRFYIHSHNGVAATMMAMQMMISGFNVEVRPFAAPAGPAFTAEVFAEPAAPARPPLLSRLVSLLRVAAFGRPRPGPRPAPAAPGNVLAPEGPGAPPPGD